MNPISFNLWDKKITITPLGLKNSPWSTKPTNTYEVEITRGEHSHITEFYDSIHHTYENPRQDTETLIYDILNCLHCDYFTDPEEHADIFIDSLNNLNLTLRELQNHITKVLNHHNALQQLFTPQEIEQLTEDNGQLEQLVNSLEITTPQ